MGLSFFDRSHAVSIPSSASDLRLWFVIAKLTVVLGLLLLLLMLLLLMLLLLLLLHRLLTCRFGIQCSYRDSALCLRHSSLGHIDYVGGIVTHHSLVIVHISSLYVMCSSFRFVLLPCWRAQRDICVEEMCCSRKLSKHSIFCSSHYAFHCCLHCIFTN